MHSTILQKIYDNSVEKRKPRREQSSGCFYKDNRSCDGCKKMAYIESKKSWCYESKFGLKREDPQMRYKRNGETKILFTNIIETSVMFESEPMEDNFIKIEPQDPPNRLNILERACDIHSIAFDVFFNTIQDVARKMGVKRL